MLPTAKGGPAVELSFPASPAHLADLRRSVRAGLKGVVPERDLDDILIALNEAATNAVLYGSGGGQPVEVAIRVRGDWAEVSVLDRGPPPRGGGRGTDSEAAHHGGRGLWLMGGLVDEVRLERVDLGTRITLRRRIGARAEPPKGGRP
jgi:anti-sigma regulatory factor (Ser/Thr protein kinase)